MSKKVTDFDTSELETIIANLSEENRKSAIFKSILEGAKELQEQTKINLRKSLGSGASSGTKYGRPMEQGVKVGRKDKDYLEVSVHIMGDHRLKWFEKGTDQRHRVYKTRNPKVPLTKEAFTGQIRPLHFFQEARNNYDTILNSITDKLNKEIQKIMK